MMTRLGYCVVNGSNVGRRGRGNSLRMRMPVADKMETLSMQLVDLSLFLASVGKVQISRPTIHRAWTSNARDGYLVIGEACEQLASSLQ